MHSLKAPLQTPIEMSKKAFAELVGLSPGRISQLIRKGLPVTPSGKINVAEGKVWITENVSPTRAMAQKDDQASFLDATAQHGFAKQKLRLATEQADKVAIQNAQSRGELLKASEVEREWSDILRMTRAELLALAPRLSQILPHLGRADIAKIDAEIRRSLENLANGGVQ